MSKGLQVTLISIGVVVVAAALVLIGINVGRSAILTTGAWTDGLAGYRSAQFGAFPGPRMGSGTVGGYGMMGGYGTPGGYGMMGGYGTPGGYGMMDGFGMMGGYGMMDGYGMMGGYTGGALLGAEPLSIEQARTAVAGYLEAIGAEDLTIGEVMIFDNHAYVQVLEHDSEFGAFELLVDPVTLTVYPEYGPNMMWNLKYGMMAGSGTAGMMGGPGMMGGYGMMGGRSIGPAGRLGWLPVGGAELDPSDQPVDPEQAVQIAQDYLEAALPGTQAESEADAFYGYYTIHILREGDTVGMLSVNGSTGQVWLHSWHGDLIEMTEHD